MSFLLPDNQENLPAAPVLRLAASFPAAVSEEACDALEEELLEYTLLPSTDLPSVERTDGKPTQSAELCVFTPCARMHAQQEVKQSVCLSSVSIKIDRQFEAKA